MPRLAIVEVLRATARSLLSIMENFQDERGVVTVPEVLRSYGAPATLGRKPD